MLTEKVKRSATVSLEVSTNERTEHVENHISRTLLLETVDASSSPLAASTQDALQHTLENGREDDLVGDSTVKRPRLDNAVFPHHLSSKHLDQTH